jgi:hypothetical protein
MNCWITVAIFNVSLLAELGDLLSEFPVVADAAAREASSFFHMSAVLVVAGVACLDAVELRSSVLERRT